MQRQYDDQVPSTSGMLQMCPGYQLNYSGTSTPRSRPHTPAMSRRNSVTSTTPYTRDRGATPLRPGSMRMQKTSQWVSDYGRKGVSRFNSPTTSVISGMSGMTLASNATHMTNISMISVNTELAAQCAIGKVAPFRPPSSSSSTKENNDGASFPLNEPIETLIDKCIANFESQDVEIRKKAVNTLQKLVLNGSIEKTDKSKLRELMYELHAITHASEDEKVVFNSLLALNKLCFSSTFLNVMMEMLKERQINVIGLIIYRLCPNKTYTSRAAHTLVSLFEKDRNGYNFKSYIGSRSKLLQRYIEILGTEIDETGRQAVLFGMRHLFGGSADKYSKYRKLFLEKGGMSILVDILKSNTDRMVLFHTTRILALLFRVKRSPEIFLKLDGLRALVSPLSNRASIATETWEAIMGCFTVLKDQNLVGRADPMIPLLLRAFEAHETVTVCRAIDFLHILCDLSAENLHSFLQLDCLAKLLSVMIAESDEEILWSGSNLILKIISFENVARNFATLQGAQTLSRLLTHLSSRILYMVLNCLCIATLHPEVHGTLLKEPCEVVLGLLGSSDITLTQYCIQFLTNVSRSNERNKTALVEIRCPDVLLKVMTMLADPNNSIPIPVGGNRNDFMMSIQLNALTCISNLLEKNRDAALQVHNNSAAPQLLLDLLVGMDWLTKRSVLMILRSAIDTVGEFKGRFIGVFDKFRKQNLTSNLLTLIKESFKLYAQSVDVKQRQLLSLDMEYSAALLLQLLDNQTMMEEILNLTKHESLLDLLGGDVDERMCLVLLTFLDRVSDLPTASGSSTTSVVADWIADKKNAYLLQIACEHENQKFAILARNLMTKARRATPLQSPCFGYDPMTSGGFGPPS